MLEERKAHWRIELTMKVNGEILQFCYFVGDIDNRLLETLAQSANDYWS